MSNAKPRKMICPICGLPGYGPYVEMIRDEYRRIFRERMQVVHRVKIEGKWKTLKTCYL